jgi:peptide/nickel transport system permease protein
MAVLGLAVVLVSVALAIMPQLVAHFDPFQIGHAQISPPSFEYFFGTDNLGRDVFSRVVWGMRAALIVAVGSAGVSGVVGILLGAISGYHGGLVDDVLARVFDIVLMIPRFFLILAVVALFGSKLSLVTILIGLTSWPPNARIMRSQVLTLKSRAYVQAASGFGATSWHIIFDHIVPNGIYPVITNMALQMGQAILVEAGLSFLGLGDANIISWGQLINLGQNYMGDAWWMSVFPGLAMLVLVLAFNMVSDGLAHALNPRLRES